MQRKTLVDRITERYPVPVEQKPKPKPVVTAPKERENCEVPTYSLAKRVEREQAIAQQKAAAKKKLSDEQLFARFKLGFAAFLVLFSICVLVWNQGWLSASAPPPPAIVVPTELEASNMAPSTFDSIDVGTRETEWLLVNTAKAAITNVGNKPVKLEFHWLTRKGGQPVIEPREIPGGSQLRLALDQKKFYGLHIKLQKE